MAYWRRLGSAPLVGAVLFLSAWILGCQTPQSQAPPPSTAVPETGEVLRVGITANMPPLIYRQDGQITGLEVELAKGLGQFLNRPIKFVEIPWDDQISHLLAKKIDIIMSGMSITDMRRMRIAFCAPYAKTGQMALIRREDIQRFQTGYYSLVEIPSIGAVHNTTGDVFIRSRFPDTRKIFYGTLDDGVRALMGHKVDVLVYDAPAVMLAAAKFENWLAPIPKMFTNEYLAWAVRKDNPELLREANAYVAQLKSKGQLQEMVNRWIPFSK
jgi:polar amino acid transport system substrate-binding protein